MSERMVWGCCMDRRCCELQRVPGCGEQPETGVSLLKGVSLAGWQRVCLLPGMRPPAAPLEAICVHQ